MAKNIVILHGWASQVKKWDKFKAGLEKEGFQIFFPPLPGFGKNKLVKAWNLADYADWLGKFLAQNELKSFVLLGHSFGASLAIKFSSQRPRGLGKLILVNSAGIRRGLTPKKLLFLVLAKIGRVFFLVPPFSFLKKPAQWLLYTLAREKDYFKVDKVMKKTMKKILKEDLKSVLKKIKVPTLIVWGEKDKATPVKDAYLMKKLIANSQLVVYDGIGHGVPFEKTDQLIKEIINFC